MQKLHYLIVFIISLSVSVPLLAYAAGPELIEFRNITDYIKFENKMKAQLNMPITAVNYETGELEPDKQKTTDYTIPVFHEEKTDLRVVVFIDENADKRSQTIIDKDIAVQRGWVFDREEP